MVFFEACPDLLTGANCDVLWFDHFSPLVEYVGYILLGVNALLLLAGIWLLIGFCKDSVPRAAQAKSKFPRQLKLLNILSTIGSAGMHIGLYSTGSLFRFDLDEPLGVASVFFWSLAWAFAFPTAIYTNILLQLIMAGPVQEEREKEKTRGLLMAKGLANILTLKIVSATKLSTIAYMLAPVVVLWVVGWSLLVAGVFGSVVVAFRYFLGVISLPLMSQGIMLLVVGGNLNTVIDTIVTSDALDSSTKTQFLDIKRRMQRFRTVLGPLMLFNGIASLIFAATKIAHEKTVFLVTNIFFDFSLAVYFILLIHLLRVNRKKAKQKVTEETIIDNTRLQESAETIPPSV